MATIKGKWRFNDVLTKPAASFDEAVNFEFAIHHAWAGLAASGIGKGFNIKANASTSDIRWALYYGYDIHYDNGEIYEDTERSVYSATDQAWITADGEEFQTVDFGTEPQTVSEEFYTWLTDNATQPSASVQYNGSTIASLFGGAAATLKCAGMKMESDVVVEVAEHSGGGGASAPVLAPLFVTKNGVYDTAYEAATVTWDETTEYDGTIEVDGATLRYKKVANLTVPDDVSELENPEYCFAVTFPDGTVQSTPLSELRLGSADGIHLANDISFAVVWVKDATFVNAGYGASLEDNTVYVTDYLWLAYGEDYAGAALTLTAPGQKIDGFSSVTVAVESSPPVLQTLEVNITEPGIFEFTPDAGYDGIIKVVVGVDAPQLTAPTISIDSDILTIESTDENTESFAIFVDGVERVIVENKVV